MEKMYNVRNVTNHPVHLTYKNEKGMPTHITLEPNGTGAIPRAEMISAVLNPFVEHKGEITPADDECQFEIDKMRPAVETVSRVIQKVAQKTGNKPGKDI